MCEVTQWKSCPALGAPQHLTVDDVAEEFQCSERTVRRWISEGRLLAFKVGRQWRIRSSDLDRLIGLT